MLANIVVVDFDGASTIDEGTARRCGMVPDGIGRLLLQEPAYESRPEAVLDPDVRRYDRLRPGHALPGALLPLQVGVVAVVAVVVVVVCYCCCCRYCCRLSVLVAPT